VLGVREIDASANEQGGRSCWRTVMAKNHMIDGMRQSLGRAIQWATRRGTGEPCISS
jgi:hypothetical protein